MLQVVTPCSLVGKYQHFVETCCLYLQSFLRELKVALWNDVTSSGGRGREKEREGEGHFGFSTVFTTACPWPLS